MDIVGHLNLTTKDLAVMSVMFDEGLTNQGQTPVVVKCMIRNAAQALGMNFNSSRKSCYDKDSVGILNLLYKTRCIIMEPWCLPLPPILNC